MSRLVRHLLISIVLGILVGMWLGPRAAFFGPVGTFTIQVLKWLAIPLLFFGIVDTFCKTKIGASDGLRLVSFSTLNACAALIISLALSRSFPLEKFLDLHRIQSLLPSHGHTAVHRPKGLDSIIWVVIGAIASGLLARSLPTELRDWISGWISRAYRIIQRTLTFVIEIIPVAVFCILAKIVGSSGLALLPALGIFVGIVAFGMLIQIGVYYSSLLRYAGIRPREFFSDVSEALLTAFSTGSSLATLPVTLRVLEEKREIPSRFARLAAAIGTNLNHDGIILYEATAAFFVARIYGIPLTIPQQVSIALTSVVAAVGIAGIPEAGFITLSLVLAAAGLPLEAAALLLPVDWLIGRLRATTNVASDMTVAHLLVRKPVKDL